MQHDQKKKERERGWSLLIKEKESTNKQTKIINTVHTHTHSCPHYVILAVFLVSHPQVPASSAASWKPLKAAHNGRWWWATGQRNQRSQGPILVSALSWPFSSEILIMVKGLLAWLGSLLGSQICVARNAQPPSSLAEALKHTLTVSERAFHESLPSAHALAPTHQQGSSIQI